ncbi:MAG: glycosyltransferase family 4 protein [bacterium]
MKRKKIALFDPYLDVLGGGEKHILSIIKAISKNADIEIFWDTNIYNDIKSRLNIEFENPPIFNKNIFSSKKNLIQKLQTLKKYDLFFYVTNGSYFFSSANKNFVFCMVPDQKLFKKTLLNKLKVSNFRYISNSNFTRKWLSKWNIQSDVIYPYIDQEFISFDITSCKKERIILSVGRFFKHLHSKRQDLLIKAFQDLKKQNGLFSDYKLILAGGVKKEDQEYFSSLKNKIKNDKSIEFKANISFKGLVSLYKKSSIFWHIAGFGIDESKNPELTEHFGMAPLEAMAMGCITFGYNAGGLKETIKNNKNGFLFSSIEELKNKTTNLLENTNKLNLIRKNAKMFIVNNFQISSFNRKALKVIYKNQ